MAEIQFIDSDSTPKCPYCEKEITTIEKIKKATFPMVNFIFLCPNCKKILSINAER